MRIAYAQMPLINVYTDVSAKALVSLHICRDSTESSLLDDDISTKFSCTHSYCKFRNFRENFIFAKKIKSHICDV